MLEPGYESIRAGVRGYIRVMRVCRGTRGIRVAYYSSKMIYVETYIGTIRGVSVCMWKEGNGGVCVGGGVDTRGRGRNGSTKGGI